ncbi:MAG: hypothetical protein H7Y17_04250 [Chlorobia bacterium]|nr:hypothetical protein [Fimbriimonadaceae bacterium]
MFRYAATFKPFLGALCLGIAIGCSQKEPIVSNAPPPADAEPKLITVGDFSLHPPIQAGSVAIVPVSLNKTPSTQDGNFITLAEAKKEGLVEISELGDEEVNALQVTNKGTRPLLLLGGDLLLGGKQDRIVARDVIVPPGKTMNVEVYCVEHGRWDDRSEHFEYKDTVVPEKVRQAAAHEGQSAVWSEVDGYNAKNGAGGGSLTVMAGMGSEKVTKSVDGNLPKVLKEVGEHKNVVGFIYIRNGKLQSADLFGNPKVLDATKNSLIRGYLSDGAAYAVEPDATISTRVYRKFMEDILKDRDNRSKRSVAGKTGKWEAGALRGVEINGSADFGDGFVHGNYSPKSSR